jgi:mannose-6-phosphate isomerase-like protein (cupin superfamily)
MKNLDEVEPFGDGSGPVDGRFARKFLDSKELGVSRFRYAANAKAAYGHKHGSQEEAYVVVSGSGRMKLDDEIIDLNVWDVIRVAPEVVRAFEGGPDGLELIAVGGTKPEGGDGEMVQDFWP